MIDHKHSFALYMFDLVRSVDADFNFYNEPNYGVVIYPAVILEWGSARKSKTLSMWEQEVQIDILVTDWDRAKCDLVTAKLIEALNLDEDNPRRQRRIPKVKSLDDNDGSILEHSLPYLQNNSDIQWRMTPDFEISTLSEQDNPELMHNTFTLSLYYKNR